MSSSLKMALKKAYLRSLSFMLTILFLYVQYVIIVIYSQMYCYALVNLSFPAVQEALQNSEDYVKKTKNYLP